MSANEVKVSVCVVTYNQEQYITQCLQSLVDQETDFNFEVIVSDDSSTDRTPEIIKDFQNKYPDIIKPILHKKNMGAYKNFIFVHEQAKGKYIAHMDGDDYALPEKLQKQANYLDENNCCNIVWSRMKILDQKSHYLYEDLLNNKIITKKFKQEDLLTIGSIACNSAKMYRKKVAVNVNAENNYLDFYINVVQLKSGYAYIIGEFLGVYRSGVGVSTSSNIKNIFIKNLVELAEIFPDKKHYISALFLKYFLIDLKKGSFNFELLLFFIKYFGIFTLVYFLKNIKYIKHFRSPL